MKITYWESEYDLGGFMNVRKIGAVGATIAAAAAIAVSVPGQAFAANYALDGQDPVSAGCSSDATTIESATVYANDITGAYATVDLRYSVKCHAAWARIRTNDTEYSTYAWIDREQDAKAYSCHALTWSSSLGAYSCYTPVLYDLSPLQSRAEGNVQIGTTNFQGFTSYY
ncbi:DUF2690 domain-containing protein [Streptacidiphilus fuscans]|uniref:DUF2690 domain-containing protein n=1 Tax=Streptacidiphilus fuscans TaxID=2789292 RepID=A0A931BGH2_9ACTN|nr:DUF2690 domain-containing protein [Streptacidiphilus fuscans]MBF9072209.1 DUF2690 domain-containing protein [Streptacidiphilus fuscans]MBF9073020.1 DUF2690 domain-containing protein [Streptacidiphilus fuscans]